MADMAMRKYKLNPATGQLEEQSPPTPDERQKLLEQCSKVFTEDMTPKVILEIAKRSKAAKLRSLRQREHPGTAKRFDRHHGANGF
jgi:hypothetical protein